jgi:hypothetical protein
VQVRLGGAVLVLRLAGPLAPPSGALRRRQVIPGGSRQPLGVGIVEGQPIDRQVIRLERERGIERRRPRRG